VACRGAGTGAGAHIAKAVAFLGGSMASSLQGEPRSTNDLDLVVDRSPGQVGAFKAALGVDFESG